MKLTFKPPHVRNTVITNEQGHVLYSTSTSFSFGTRETVVKKHVPNEFNIGRVESSEILAKIEWHTFTSTVIEYAGMNLATSQFIPTKGILGRRRVFRGPDGHLYKWKIGPRECILMLGATEVARHHPLNLGFKKAGHEAYLEVFSPVEHMVDLVVLTFIYVEKLRRGSQESPGTDRMHAPIEPAN
ncbi:uncharacterized protein BJ212DRAFT_107875 [Suillus subaureus]|uniref:DUF6593 domain-containing protein n=1 Tax=Suillus subaureus TaxID=48587 RepID=A0A9P7EE65_9AGAM|nr:uncharacterized protein BJ212DRAFT_107875 [Suillus subaureus]KAG1818737.1 hypothetical protein BJ212DRAFT_107875 [Suillus subaureus]